MRTRRQPLFAPAEMVYTRPREKSTDETEQAYKAFLDRNQELLAGMFEANPDENDFVNGKIYNCKLASGNILIQLSGSCVRYKARKTSASKYAVNHGMEGSGSFGIFDKSFSSIDRNGIINVKQHGKRRGIKTISGYVNPQADKIQDQIIQHEVAMLEKVGMYHVKPVVESGSGSAKRSRIILRYFEGMDLLELINKKDIKWNDEQTINLFIKLLEALLPLHEKKIAHLDIKPDNVRVSLTVDDDNNVISIDEAVFIDLGVSREITSDAKAEMVGCIYYVAPEVIKADKFNEKTDLYSFAVMCMAFINKSIFTVLGFMSFNSNPIFSDHKKQTEHVFRIVLSGKRLEVNELFGAPSTDMRQNQYRIRVHAVLMKMLKVDIDERCDWATAHAGFKSIVQWLKTQPLQNSSEENSSVASAATAPSMRLK